MTKHGRDPAIVEQIERQAIRDVVARVAHTVDFRQWDALRALFDDTVTTDYTSLFGGEIQRQRAENLIDGWRRLLSPLDATQHLLGPIAVALRAGEATAECHVRGDHVKAGAPGGDAWTVGGQWRIGLVRHGDGWRITAMTLRLLFQSGNRDLLSVAAG